MINFLSRKNIIVCISFIIILNSCKPAAVSYKELQKMDSTHMVNNHNLVDSINEILKDSVNFGKFEHQIIILIIEKKEKNYEVCISRTDYNVFKSHRPDAYDILKGYSNYQNIPILLFGDIDSTFFKRKDNEFYNILGELPVYNLENPPILYEPRVLCTEIE